MSNERMRSRSIFVSGAPGTGKSTVARLVADELRIPVLSVDPVKEALADVLGLGDDEWSNSLGDAAAEVVFRLARSFPEVVVEGWWRRERRLRAEREFAGWIQVFCRCSPETAARRMRARHGAGRHPIHRDVINADVVEQARQLVATVQPLAHTGPLIELDTEQSTNPEALIAQMRRARE